MKNWILNHTCAQHKYYAHNLPHDLACDVDEIKIHARMANNNNNNRSIFNKRILLTVNSTAIDCTLATRPSI